MAIRLSMLPLLALRLEVRPVARRDWRVELLHFPLLADFVFDFQLICGGGPLVGAVGVEDAVVRGAIFLIVIHFIVRVMALLWSLLCGVARGMGVAFDTPRDFRARTRISDRPVVTDAGDDLRDDEHVRLESCELRSRTSRRTVEVTYIGMRL